MPIFAGDPPGAAVGRRVPHRPGDGKFGGVSVVAGPVWAFADASPPVVPRLKAGLGDRRGRDRGGPRREGV